MSKKFVDPLNTPFVFPQSILSQIDECSENGYLLFFIDQMGRPQVRANFNAPITEMGLRAYASKFLKGINMVEESNIAETIFEESNTDSEEDSNQA